MTTRKNKHKKTIKGGFRFPARQSFAVAPSVNGGQTTEWRRGGHQWSTLVRLFGLNGQPLHIYASSLPPIDTMACIRVLSYYMYTKHIKSIMSFQGCSLPNVGHNVGSCQSSITAANGGTGRVNLAYEDNIWQGLKQLTMDTRNDPRVGFYNYIIPDMTAGTWADSWVHISGITWHDPDDMSLIHCLAGLGRTGSVILFILLEDFFNYQDPVTGEPNIRRLRQPWLGTGSSANMVASLQGLLNNGRRLDTGNDATAQAAINLFGPHINEIDLELIRFGSHSQARMFITRINFIILAIARRRFNNNNNIGNWIIDNHAGVYLYPVYQPGQEPPGWPNAGNLFGNPFLVQPNFNNINLPIQLPNPFGIA